jgi:hypothetical protein
MGEAALDKPANSTSCNTPTPIQDEPSSLPMPSNSNLLPVSHPAQSVETPITYTPGFSAILDFPPLPDTPGSFSTDPLDSNLDPEWLVNLSKDIDLDSLLQGDASMSSDIGLLPSSFDLSSISNVYLAPLVAHSTPISHLRAPLVNQLRIIRRHAPLNIVSPVALGAEKHNHRRPVQPQSRLVRAG